MDEGHLSRVKEGEYMHVCTHAHTQTHSTKIHTHTYIHNFTRKCTTEIHTHAYIHKHT